MVSYCMLVCSGKAFLRAKQMNVDMATWVRLLKNAIPMSSSTHSNTHNSRYCNTPQTHTWSPDRPHELHPLLDSEISIQKIQLDGDSPPSVTRTNTQTVNLRVLITLLSSVFWVLQHHRNSSFLLQTLLQHWFVFIYLLITFYFHLYANKLISYRIWYFITIFYFIICLGSIAAP